MAHRMNTPGHTWGGTHARTIPPPTPPPPPPLPPEVPPASPPDMEALKTLAAYNKISFEEAMLYPHFVASSISISPEDLRRIQRELYLRGR